jgi:response regulator RpfG family c-di-GMP phosphodiesterase
MNPKAASPAEGFYVMTPTSVVEATKTGPPDAKKSNASGSLLLHELLSSSLIFDRSWEALSSSVQEELTGRTDNDELLGRLVELELLTEYQSRRIRAGKLFGLILGNYRVVDRLGAGGMGEVFQAQNLYLPRPVAIKVLAHGAARNPRLVRRFFTEMEAVARLNHPNIVNALDAGQLASPDPETPGVYYLVMEYVPGQDLDRRVQGSGPLPVAESCDLINQVASALAEAHKHNLIHRDIKPSNILVTPDGQAKLLDFGLARQFSSNLTIPGTILGTLPFIAPEQARDAGSVDLRADIYALGTTLFWCLTGNVPFPEQDNIFQDLERRLTVPPPSARNLRPEIPVELDAVIARMMAINPDDRYPSAQSVMRALRPFLSTEATDFPDRGEQADKRAVPNLHGEPENSRSHRILIVDDEPDIRMTYRFTLEADGFQCEEAVDGAVALAAMSASAFDLVLADLDMPQMTGLELLHNLRKHPPTPHLKVIMISGRSSADEMSQMLQAGADDYLTKPVSYVQLRARIQSALRLKEAQERSDVLKRKLLAANAELERNLTCRDSDLVHARNAMVMALSKLVENRCGETGAHLFRMQKYCRSLAEAAAGLQAFAGQIDANFMHTLECCVPLHDMGNLALPDHILLNPGKLESEERLSMQSHTVLGANTLQEVAERHGSALGFMEMAIEIARHHHERYDGTGYPDRIEGDAIPLAARIVSVCDVYDALRCRRSYRAAMSHAATLEVITGKSAKAFDPNLLEAFQRCAPAFDRIFKDNPDRGGRVWS